MADRWGLPAAAALAAVLALLTGCAGKQPANETLPTTTAQSSPTEQELPPLGPADFPMPAEAREKSPEGAVEFTRYYIDLIAYVANGNLDPQPLLELSQNCEICLRIADSFESDRAAGYTYGDVWVRFDDYAPPSVTGDEAEVFFIYAQSALTVYDRSGQAVDAESADETGDLASGALLVWREELNSWVVTTLTIG